MKAQLRFEIFNIFNRVNFLSNQLNVGIQPGGSHVRHGQRDDGDEITGFSGIPGNFGQSSNTRDARQAQFGIKLQF